VERPVLTQFAERKYTKSNAPIYFIYKLNNRKPVLTERRSLKNIQKKNTSKQYEYQIKEQLHTD
jgi:REP element-mobilizing transposase RayT